MYTYSVSTLLKDLPLIYCVCLKDYPPPLMYCACLNDPLLPFPLTERISQTVSIDATTVDIEEKGVKLRLTVVDTPGFGDAVNNTQW